MYVTKDILHNDSFLYSSLKVTGPLRFWLIFAEFLYIEFCLCLASLNYLTCIELFALNKLSHTPDFSFCYFNNG